MPSSPEKRISGLKIVAWTFRVLALIILAVLIIEAANLFLYLPSLISYSSMANAVVPFVPLAVGIGLLQWGAARMFDEVEDAKENLDEKIVGYILSNKVTSFETLSRWTGIPQRRVADLAARLAAKGRFSGYTIDLASQSISNTPPYAVGPTSPPPPPPSYPRAQTAFSPSDEVVKVKAKLYELEALKRQGRIADGEYNEMKDELEKRLANLDTGTQVY